MEHLEGYLIQCSTFLVYIITVIIAKKQVVQRSLIKALMEEIKDKSQQLEEVAVLKERNRIAGEMHDTVGHTLTAALVEIEAAKLLFDDRPEACRTKLDLAGDQMRKGLKELRDSVKKVSAGESLLAFLPSMQALQSEVEKHMNARVHLDMHPVEGLLPIQEKVLYQAVLEAITNGIKHGAATEFHISLHDNGDIVDLAIRDNGKGKDGVVSGFGLTVMQDRIQGLGGRINMESAEGKGFVLKLEIPKGRRSHE